MKPFAESSEQNKQPILDVLRQYLTVGEVLEIGSGTGQHAVYFSQAFPEVHWITSDQADYLQGIQMWLNETEQENLSGPHHLDVNQANWPVEQVDYVFSANTVHIMGWDSVVNMFAGIGKVLKLKGLFLLYGPFNYNGEFTSESNARFDLWLKQRDPVSGVRDFEALNALAEKAGMQLVNDHQMPANNRILVWQKVN